MATYLTLKVAILRATKQYENNRLELEVELTPNDNIDEVYASTLAKLEALAKLTPEEILEQEKEKEIKRKKEEYKKQLAEGKMPSEFVEAMIEIAAKNTTS